MARFSELQREIADMLFDVGAVQFGAFCLKLHEREPTAPLSPIYLNLRTAENPKPGPLLDVHLSLIIEGWMEMIGRRRIKVGHPSGIPNAGSPMGEALAQRIGFGHVPMIKGQTGTKRRITGLDNSVSLRSMTRVLLVDDVITGADTKLEALRVLRQAGLEVSELLVVVDREQTGASVLAKWGCSVHALFYLTELLNYYVQTMKITGDQHQAVLDYMACERTGA